MALSAEKLIEHEAVEHDLPLVIDVSNLPEDKLLRAQAAILIQSVGSVAVRNEVEDSQRFEENREGYANLMEAVHAAAVGDPLARRVLEVNV